MAKTIEGIFHPRSLKMRHEMVKTHGVGGGGGGATSAGGSSKGSGGTGGSGLELLQLQGSTATATVRGKTREEVQKLFVDVLRNVSHPRCKRIPRVYRIVSYHIVSSPLEAGDV